MSKEKILIITDTTSEQINGVVRTMEKTINLLREKFIVDVIDPSKFKTFDCPFYKEIKMAYNASIIDSLISSANPKYIHICTEGPIGFAAKKYCDKKGLEYTTSYHSMFPEFFKAMFGIPTWITYKYFRSFHKKSKAVFVPTYSIKELLEQKGFKNVIVWSRGVDQKLFNPIHRKKTISGKTLTKEIPITNIKEILCVSRVSKEKGLDDFCSMKLPDNFVKILVGDGPYLQEILGKGYSDLAYLGKEVGEQLASTYANADVFVFPSKTDTFGLVMLEAIASGTPVVAYDTNGSREIIIEGVNGFIVDDLASGVEQALALDRKKVEETAKKWTWEACTQVFINNLVKCNPNV